MEKSMKPDNERLLSDAILALRAAEPNAKQLADSAAQVASRLGISAGDEFAFRQETGDIDGCADVQRLLSPYQAGTLAGPQSLLIRAHLRDCVACRGRLLRGESGRGVLDWTAPSAADRVVWRPRSFGWALAACLALFGCSLFVYKAYWQVPPGVRAEVRSIDGPVYLLSNRGDRPISAGDDLTEGEHLRTTGGAHAVLRLADGSTVEVNERSVLAVGARGRNMTVSLESGRVIVQAAKRTAGHLYVQTPDCRVAVTGTVFSVNSGIKGSRVAVLQGAVHVEHAGTDALLQAGEQVATNDAISPVPIDQQIAWSQDREKYLVLLAQFATLQHHLEQIPTPPLRYTSDLLDRVPANTLLYISIPNLGDFLNQANGIFNDQLKESPALQQWWSARHGNTADLDALVAKLHQMSGYLGDEIVIAGAEQANGRAGFAVIADVQKSGLADFLTNQFAQSDSTPGITVFDERLLAAAPAPTTGQAGEYAVVREREVVFSNDLGTLKQINAQLDAGASGFATGVFGQQIQAAYARGAGVILAADVHQMLIDRPASTHDAGSLENSGMDNVQYLIAEHREANGLPENHLNLQFSGTRQRVASWLAAPGPIGSLDFVTPNASFAVAALSKDPKEIADDIMAMTAPEQGTRNSGWTETEEKPQINVREDLAANLGGEVLISLDGPVLPTPSWKAVIEVRDAEKLESALERLTEAVNQQAQSKNAHHITIESSQIGEQKFYAVRDLTTGSMVASYTFADGYMVMAPDRAVVVEALRAHANGNTLARASAFKALLPSDQNDNYSAIAYQNLSPVLTPLLSQVSGESANALREMAEDARPTAILAWGKDTRIEAASNSHLFGFEFLTLADTISHEGGLGGRMGNNQVRPSVRQ
jgi:FecR protein/Putative zinc-finger